MDYFKNIDHYPCSGNEPKQYGIKYRVVTDTATEPVTLEFFKEHARIDFDTDDTLSTSYIKAARIFLERWSQLSFGVKTMGLTALYLPNNYELMYGPVNSVITDNYTNKGNYLVEGGNDVDIEYTTLGIDVNEDIKIAICRKAASYYLYRESVTDAKTLEDEAKEMIRPLMNITLF